MKKTLTTALTPATEIQVGDQIVVRGLVLTIARTSKNAIVNSVLLRLSDGRYRQCAHVECLEVVQ